jgi:hypothetical protein
LEIPKEAVPANPTHTAEAALKHRGAFAALTPLQSESQLALAASVLSLE